MKTLWQDTWSKKKAIYEQGSGLLPDTESADALIWGFPVSRLWEISVGCLSHPVYGIFVSAAPINWDTFLIFTDWKADMGLKFKYIYTMKW